MSSKRLYTYLALVFLIGWLFQGLAISRGVSGAGRQWMYAAMWAPMLAALLTGRESRARIWLRLKKSGWKVWPVALLAGWSFSILQVTLLWATRRGHWNSDLFVLSGDGRSIDSIHHVAMTLGLGAQSFLLFALNLVVSVAFGSLITMLIGGIGEEAGWRGLLQEELERRFGLFKGTLLVGLIWGYWHLPVNLAGYNDAQHPILQAAVIFQVHTIAMSFALAWLVRLSGSLWPAALGHAANNVLQFGPLLLPNGWRIDQLTACVASIALGAIFCWLLVRHGRQPRNKSPKQHGFDPLKGITTRLGHQTTCDSVTHVSLGRVATKSSLLLVAGILVLASRARAADWSHRWTLSGQPNLQLVSGGVDLIVEEGAPGAIEAQLETTGWSLGRPAAKIDQRQEGDLVIIRVETRPYVGMRYCRLLIRVPSNIEADLRPGDGSVALNGLHGRFRVATLAGGIHAEDLDGSVEITSSGGPIRIRGRFDALDLHARSGAIDAEATQGSRFLSGWRIESEDGSIRIKVPPSFAANVEARSFDGRVRSELSPVSDELQSKNQFSGRLNKGGPMFLIWSRSGTIQLVNP
jgi:membrane protease YdiL (CAAX protease family)